MQEKVIPFYYSSEDNETKTVRTHVSDDGNNIWFCAKDVCKVLGLTNTRKAVDVLDDSERMTVTNSYSHERLNKHGGASKLLFVSESGLYALIFKSRKPEAQRFRKWVTSEVLPRLRKYGSVHMEETAIPTPSAIMQISKGRGIPQGVFKAANKILEAEGLKGESLSIALDRVFQIYTGYSVREIVNLDDIRNTEEERNRKKLAQLCQPLDWSWVNDEKYK